MVENQDIVQGAITKTKLSKNLRLDLTNLPKGTAGQIPIIQPDGNWGLVGLSGDVSIAADGVTTVINNAEITAADIDTAFNFIHDQKGYLHRSPQKEGDTVVYDVENTNYVTEVINNVNNVATGATKKFTKTITGDGSSTDFSITHNLKTYDIVVSVRYAIDPFNDNSGAAPSDMDDVFDYSYYTHSDVGFAGTGGTEVATWNTAQHEISKNQISLRFNPAPRDGHVYRVTIIG